MHITRVELENIKSHTAFSQEFNRGTTAITGSNGAGKTTIIEAIAWTLFDLLDYKKDDFLRRGSKKGTARVTFESQLDNRRYTVIRDTGTKYQVFDNDLKTTIANGKAEVARFLQQHLGVEPGTNLETLFRSAIGVPQGTLTAIFLEPPSVRKVAFDKLLKVEEYREGAEKLLQTANFVKNRLEETRNRIARAEGELSRLDEIENQHRETARKIAELENVLNDLRELIAEKSQAVAEFERAETLLNETRQNRERANFQLESARAAQIRVKTELDQAATAAAILKASENDYHAHQKALSELNVLDARQSERNRIQTEANRAETFLNEAKSELKRLAENLAKAVEAAREIQALQPKIVEQNDFETERERERTSRAEAEQAARLVAELEDEIKKKIERHAEIKSQLKDAASGAEASEKLRELETKRAEIEQKLKTQVQAEASLKVLQPQREQLKKEISRLRETIAIGEREIVDFDRVKTLAAETIALGQKENTLVAEIARLQAKIEHDEKFQGEVRNGLCPILSAKCLNIREGETLESYFQTELAQTYSQLGTLKNERKVLAENLVSAREAERILSRLENLRRQIEQTGNDLRQREDNLTRVETEIRSFNGFNPNSIADLRRERDALDKEIADWNAKAGKYAGMQQLETLLDAILRDGRELRERQNSAKETAAKLPNIENRLREIERNLNALGNPRERAENLRREAEQETARREQIERGKNDLAEKERIVQMLSEKLGEFASLDADLARARATRDRTLQSYQTFLANQAIAATLSVRENEFARSIEEVERLENEFRTISIQYEQAAANYNHDQHLTEKSALLDAQRREAANATELAQEKRRETDLRAEIERLFEIRKQMQAEFAEKERLDRVFEATDFIRDTLKKAAPEVAKSYLFSISREANEIFREVSGSAERTLRWTEDYEIVLEENGHERPFINLSGGEQMAAALSVRLALLKQLSDVRVAFFDEPTINLDRERRERLAQQIGQIRNFDQLFVISHDDTFEESVDYHIHVNGDQSDASAED